jgi:hypothetical protein
MPSERDLLIKRGLIKPAPPEPATEPTHAEDREANTLVVDALVVREIAPTNDSTRTFELTVKAQDGRRRDGTRIPVPTMIVDAWPTLALVEKGIEIRAGDVVQAIFEPGKPRRAWRIIGRRGLR